MITFVTQSDLFSGGTENNHDNINKDGSLRCEFSTLQFPVWNWRAAGSVSFALIIIKKHSGLIDGCFISLYCYNQQKKYTVHLKKWVSRAER